MVTRSLPDVGEVGGGGPSRVQLMGTSARGSTVERWASGRTARSPSACTRPPTPPPVHWSGSCSGPGNGPTIITTGVGGPGSLTRSGMPPRRVWPWGVAVTQLREGGFDIRDEAVARLSPFLRHHINMLGRHSFRLPDLPGDLRPLRAMDAAADPARPPGGKRDDLRAQRDDGANAHIVPTERSFGVDVVSDVDALGGERLPHGCRVLPAPAGIVRVENVFMWERACSMRVRVLRWGAWCSSCPAGSSVWPCSRRAGEGRLVSR